MQCLFIGKESEWRQRADYPGRLAIRGNCRKKFAFSQATNNAAAIKQVFSSGVRLRGMQVLTIITQGVPPGKLSAEFTVGLLRSSMLRSPDNLKINVTNAISRGSKEFEAQSRLKALAYSKRALIMASNLLLESPHALAWKESALQQRIDHMNASYFVPSLLGTPIIFEFPFIPVSLDTAHFHCHFTVPDPVPGYDLRPVSGPGL